MQLEGANTGGGPFRVYLDACCFNRPFDDAGHVRVRLEAEAIIAFLDLAGDGSVEWLVSEALEEEIERTPDCERRERLQSLAKRASVRLVLTSQVAALAEELGEYGIKDYDALHVAFAETAGANALLTTDDRLVRSATRVVPRLRTEVVNPLDWLREVSST